ncbi:hypothetical protein NMYAN_150055 [Nitrosomonas nitrosa]|uniref:Uncharacterized protein n=1 Tax=Nitrosomonas nitrosa TaxID=52442 RepID=A0A8H8YYQ1_9PROT|nr:hypothetical protein NMYAN_150055 [Nitrosomonas nitrosa]
MDAAGRFFILAMDGFWHGLYDVGGDDGRHDAAVSRTDVYGVCQSLLATLSSFSSSECVVCSRLSAGMVGI